MTEEERKECLVLAGKLATACENLLNSQTSYIGVYIRDVKIALNDYNERIMELIQ